MAAESAGAVSLASIDAVRRFNRFYTRRIGVLQPGLLRSPFSLTEARVLWELAQQESTTATQLVESLGLDPGYVSRIVRRFQRLRLVERGQSPSDGRVWLLWLTREGVDAYDRINLASQRETAAMLGQLPEERRERLVHALDDVAALLDHRHADSGGRRGCTLRRPGPGDLGWVVQAHGELYDREYDWDVRFEGLVAEIVAGFARSNDPARERCWIAEHDGRNVGSVFLVARTETVAQLRLLLVVPAARGLGIGRRLVEECVTFARGAGYERIMLWTNDVLHAARHIYESAGFTLVQSEPHHSFGHDLVGQNWELALR